MVEHGCELRIQNLNYRFARGQRGAGGRKSWGLEDGFTDTMVLALDLAGQQDLRRAEMGRGFKEKHKPTWQS